MISYPNVSDIFIYQSEGNEDPAILQTAIDIEKENAVFNEEDVDFYFYLQYTRIIL